jgi:hypothetical protein
MRGTWVSATGFRRFYRVRQYGAVSKAGYVTGSTDTGHEEDKWVSEWLKDNSILIADSDDVNGPFRRDVNKVGA